MIVFKFGGTSVADAGRLRRAAEIVLDHRERCPVVVVSALGGVTDRLVTCADAAARDDLERLDSGLAEIDRVHRWAVAGALTDAGRRHDVTLEVDRVLEELRQVLRSVRVLGEHTPRASDAILAHGERLSAILLTATLCERGVDAVRFDPESIVRTDGRSGAASVDLDGTARAAAPLGAACEAGNVPVVGGFVGSAPDGTLTTLGRGGGDTTGAALACALGADELQIWTDVDGLMTADPRRVPAARTIPLASFAEAAEMAHYGAAVLHPGAVEPAVRDRIPVRVRNTLAPAGEGTRILEDPEAATTGLAGVACRSGVTAVRIAAPRHGRDPALLRDALEASAELGAVVRLASAEATSALLVIDAPGDVSALRARFAGRARVEPGEPSAIVALVGRGFDTHRETWGPMVGVVAEHEGACVTAGISACSVAAVVPERRLEDVVRALHATFFESSSEERAR